MFSNPRSRPLAAFVAILAALASVTALAAPSNAVGGSIAGVVANEASAGLAGVDVTLYKRAGGTWIQWQDEPTSSTGKYRFAGLTSGAYRVCANERRSTPQYFQRCWQTGDSVETGRTLNLAADQVITARRIVLLEGGTISGVVAGTEPAVDGETVELEVVDTSGTIIERTTAAVGSPYTVGPLQTGSYRVQFDRASGSSRFSGQFFDGLSEVLGLAAATAVDVTAKADTPGVNATMTTGGAISGYTKTTTGVAVDNCYVFAVADDGVRTTRVAASSGTGRFVITGLSPGNYQVAVQVCVNIEKWFDASKGTKVSTVKADADPVTVSDGTTTGIGTLKVKAG